MDPLGLCAVSTAYGMGKDFLEDTLAWYDDFVPDNKLQAVLAAGGKAFAVLAYGIYTSPVELVDQCVEFAENKSLKTIPILGPLGQQIGETTAEAVLNPNADTISRAVGAYCAAGLTIAGGASVGRAISSTRAGQAVESSLRRVLKDNRGSVGLDINKTISTGRTTPKNLKEQLAMEEVKSNPKGATPPRMPKMSDAKNNLFAEDGWVKRSQNVNGVEIHYVENINTGKVLDFKFAE